MGRDFNATLNIEEKLGDLPFSHSETTDFAHRINNCALTELPSTSGKFTWSNGRKEDDCIFKKLDRFLIKQEFLGI